MGDAPLGDLSLEANKSRLTVDDLTRLIEGGIDVTDLEDVRVLVDGTLAYKDKRVVLYIRDLTNYGHRSNDGALAMPRFHVSDCEWLKKMRAQRRMGRYVVAANPTGRFRINVLDSGGATQTSMEALKVCQYCLGKLGVEGFSHDWDRARRAKVVDSFSVKKFFRLWPRDLVNAEGIGDEATAPLNDYSGSFGQVAAAEKERVNYCCQQCGRDLSVRGLREYLHAHHINGVKFDNKRENIRVLCIACHAQQPGHGHMFTLPSYIKFCSLDASWKERT